MGENSKIEWTDHTMNFWIGCRKVSPACASCYAGTLVQNRMGKAFYPPVDLGRVATDADSPVWRTKTWRDPIKWDREAREAGVIKRVFTCSLSDFFLDHPGVHEWRKEAWHLMRGTPNLLWLVLSKRWDLGAEYIAGCMPADWGAGYSNVMLGATVENQDQASRLDVLCSLPVQAGTFASCEPLLGPLELHRWTAGVYHCTECGAVGDGDSQSFEFCAEDTIVEFPSPLQWIIAGGESGSKPRPTHPNWVRDLRDVCLASRTPFHLKQFGEYGPSGQLMTTGELVFREFTSFDHWVAKGSTWVRAGDVLMDSRGRICEMGRDMIRARDEAAFPVTIISRIGKKAAGRVLDGRTWDDGPKYSAVMAIAGGEYMEMGGGMKVVTGKISIEVWVDCPHCGEGTDLMEQDDEGSLVSAVSAGRNALSAMGMEFTCPSCKQAFELEEMTR